MERLINKTIESQKNGYVHKSRMMTKPVTQIFPQCPVFYHLLRWRSTCCRKLPASSSHGSDGLLNEFIIR